MDQNPASPLRIVRADLSALEQTATLFAAYRAFYGCPPDPIGERAYLSERLRDGAAALALAWLDGEAVGLVHLFPQPSSLGLGRSFYLSDLYVAPAARGRGVARALLRFAVDFARAAGARGLSLETAHTNRAAQRLYEQMGWRRDDAFRTYLYSFS